MQSLCNKPLFWKTCLLKLLYVYGFFFLNSRQKVLLKQVCQFKVFSGNFGEQTATAKILCSFCFHSKLFIATFIACNSFWKMNSRNFFENNFSQHLMSETFCVKVARKISQLSQLFLPATVSVYKVFLLRFIYQAVYIQNCSALFNSPELCWRT